jgi:nitrite reductase (NO-forming)
VMDDGTEAWVARGAPGRVALAHRHAAPAFRQALVFALAAAMVAPVAGLDRIWVPLHLLLIGGVLSAVSGATQLFAVTWSAAPPPPTRLVVVQRWLLGAGAVVVVVGREIQISDVIVAAGGSSVIASLFLLGVLLVVIRRTAPLSRFHAAIDGYVVAVAFGIGGSVLGVLMVLDAGTDLHRTRDVHIASNLLGLVGIVVLCTVPTFVATLARTKPSRHLTPNRLRGLVALMAAGVALIVGGSVLDRPRVVTFGFACYSLAIVGVLVVLPRLRRRQWRWAGPRLIQLVTAMGWWLAAVVWASTRSMAAQPDYGHIWLVLAVGGIAQLVVASLAYLGPILRGRDHMAQRRAFAITRSWLSLGAGNLAAVSVAARWWPVVATSLLVWACDVGCRAVVLVVRVRPGSPPLRSRQ